MLKKTRFSTQLTPPDELATDELMDGTYPAGLSEREFDFLVAILSASSLKEAAEAVGYEYSWAARKRKKLAPFLDKVYPMLQQEAIRRLTLLAPKAVNALGELLDDLQDSKTDTKRKTAEAVLDRVVGKPVAKVAVKQQAEQEIKISYTGWNPPVIKPPGNEENEETKEF